MTLRCLKMHPVTPHLKKTPILMTSVHGYENEQCVGMKVAKPLFAPVKNNPNISNYRVSNYKHRLCFRRQTAKSRLSEVVGTLGRWLIRQSLDIQLRNII